MSMLKKKKEFSPFTYLGIDHVKDDVAILEDGAMVALLRVKPFAAESFSEKKHTEAMAYFQHWLDTLEYPVQIVGTTVNKDVVKQADIVLSRVENLIKQSANAKEKLKQFKQFQDWMMRHIGADVEPYRMFVIAIPYFPYYKNKTQRKLRPNYFQSLDTVTERAANAVKILSASGLDVHRMNSSEITNLYTSYFVLSILKKRYMAIEEWVNLFEILEVN
jgi:hypothetical protein